MSIASGVGLVVVGAILYWAVELDVPYLFEGALGVIAMIAGLTIIAATFVVNPRSHNMVASGLALIAAGAALVWAVDIDLPYVYDGSLGVILIFAGVITLIVAAVLDYQRNRARQDMEYRYADGSTERERRDMGYRHPGGPTERTRHWPLRR